MKLFPLTLVTISAFISFSVTVSALDSTLWPQWRGPNRDGQTGGPVWPEKLDANHLQQVWRVELGPSYSDPIVGADRVFTTETKDKKSEAVTAFDRATGRELWRAKWEGSMSVPFFAKSNGDWIRSTPALDEDRLYVAGMRDTLFTSAYGGKTTGFKVTQADGKFKVTQIWTYKAQGYMSTPVVINGVAYEHLKSQRMLAIDVETGRELWTASEGFGKYVSLVGQGDRILALDQRGLLYLFRANPKEFDLLDKRRLNDADSWAHLAVAGSDLFVRELNALAAYRWTAPAPQAPQTEASLSVGVSPR
jgi:outer membrane protein assembly factor BamB